MKIYLAFQRTFNKNNATLLYYSGKIQYIEEDDYGVLISKRAAPSAGALHPIDYSGLTSATHSGGSSASDSGASSATL
jgi:hypothetical protein